MNYNNGQSSENSLNFWTYTDYSLVKEFDESELIGNSGFILLFSNNKNVRF